jgi:hypothetical protein
MAQLVTSTVVPTIWLVALFLAAPATINLGRGVGISVINWQHIREIGEIAAIGF